MVTEQSGRPSPERLNSSNTRRYESDEETLYVIDTTRVEGWPPGMRAGDELETLVRALLNGCDGRIEPLGTAILVHVPKHLQDETLYFG